MEIRKGKVKDLRDILKLAKYMPTYKGFDKHLMWLERAWLLKYILLGNLYIYKIRHATLGFIAHRRDKIQMIVVHRDYRNVHIGDELVKFLERSLNYPCYHIRAIPETVEFWWNMGYEFDGYVKMKHEVKEDEKWYIREPVPKRKKTTNLGRNN